MGNRGVRMRKQPVNGVRQSNDIFFLDEQAGLSMQNDFRKTADACSDIRTIVEVLIKEVTLSGVTNR
jgi:hypothetical protein